MRDVDVVFLDPAYLSRDNDDRATRRLVAGWSEPPWEAKNQAAVHTWYPAKFGGYQVAPLRSIAEAVAAWPECATAVASDDRDASGDLESRRAGSSRFEGSSAATARRRGVHRDAQARGLGYCLPVGREALQRAKPATLGLHVIDKGASELRRRL